MRLALILGSAYEKNGQLPRMGSVEIDCELAARRLAEPDAGFAIQRFAADRSLPEELERFLFARAGQIDELLVYFAGYAVLSPKRGPGLFLDGPKIAGLSIRVLRSLVERHAPVSCVIIDAAAVLEPAQSAAAVVSAIGTTLTQGSSGISALVAARPSHDAEAGAGSPFTSLLMTVLDWLAAGREPHDGVDLGRVFGGLCSDPSMWRSIPAGQVFPNTAGFTMLPSVSNGAGRERLPSDRPPLQLVAAEAAPQNVYLTYAQGTARWTVSLSPKTGGGSAEALEQMLAAHPDDLALRERLVELYADYGRPERALEHCRWLTRLSPPRAEPYRHARALFERAGEPDAAWNAASVLACLGGVEAGESGLHKRRPDGLLQVRDTVFDEDWRTTLMPSVDEDPALDGLIEILGAAAVRAGVVFARHKKRPVEPRAEWLCDIEKSTTTLAKTLLWTSRVLGIEPPSLYIAPDLGSVFDIALTEEPSAIAGRGLGSGLGLSQLAFLWGRHLGRFRPQVRALGFFATADELALLLETAAAVTGHPGIPPRAQSPDGKRLYNALRAEVRGAALERLKEAAQDLSLRNLLARARRALVRAELAGVRAGLLACGDVCVAADLIDRIPMGSVVTTDEQKGELFSFAISDAYGALRQRLGVASAA